MHSLWLFTAMAILGQRVREAKAEEANPDSFSLYAYGSDSDGNAVIGGLPVFYADGRAYAGTTPPSNASSVAEVYFNKSTSDTTQWVITVNSTYSTANESAIDGDAIAINAHKPAYEAVAFLPNDTNSTAMSTNGFYFYGSIAMWMNTTSGELQSLFYATPVENQTDLYLLRWNSAAVVDTSSLAVTLKATAPSSDQATTLEDA